MPAAPLVMMRTAETIGDDAAFPPSSTAVRGAADQTQRVHARAKVEVLSAASGSCVQVEDAVAARDESLCATEFGVLLPRSVTLFILCDFETLFPTGMLRCVGTK
jgi:hypothetical protein